MRCLKSLCVVVASLSGPESEVSIVGSIKHITVMKLLIVLLTVCHPHMGEQGLCFNL